MPTDTDQVLNDKHNPIANGYDREDRLEDDRVRSVAQIRGLTLGGDSAAKDVGNILL
jgi:hypothetical protein